MNNTNDKSKKSILRQKALDLLKINLSKKSTRLHESETTKLLHELEVYEIELEFQNDELKQANAINLETAKKYTELYDFAPSGYVTLSNEGKMVQLNLTASKILGKERSLLINNSFGFFVSQDTKPIFNDFLKKVFNNNVQESCELTLLTKDKLLINVILEGVQEASGEKCLISIVNISERVKQEKELQATEEKAKRAEELVIANKELAQQNKEKAKRAAELVIANKELAHQNKEKAKRAEELVIANKELAQQNKEKAKRAEELVIANKELAHQNKEKANRAEELYLAKEISEEKTDELNNSLLLNRSILECVGEGIYGLDLGGNSTFINQNAADMLGYTKEELIGKGMHKNHHHHKLDGTEYPISECPIYAPLTTGIAHTITNEVFWHKDGTSFPVEYTSAPLYTDGKLNGAVVVFRDISERKLSEKKTIESEEKYRSLVDEVNDGFYILDNQGTFIFSNNALAKIFGLNSSEELIGRHWSDFAPDNNEVKEAKRFYNDIENNKGGSLITAAKRIEGQNIFIEITSYPLLKNDKIIGMRGIIRDVTEQKEAEKLSTKQHELGMELSSVSDSKELYTISMKALFEVSGMKAGGIYLFDNKENLNLVYSDGLSDKIIDSVSRYNKNSDNVKLVNAGKAVFVDYKDLAISHTEIEKNMKFLSIAILPISNKAGTIGCINIASPLKIEISENSKKGIENMVTLIGNAISRIQQEKKIRQMNAELEKKVEKRTNQLSKSNKKLKRQIKDKTRLFHELDSVQIELQAQNEELHKFQKNLREAIEKYFDLYNLAPVGFLTISEDGIILEANQAVVELLGIELNQISNKPLTNFILKEDQDVYYFFDQKLKETEKKQSTEIRMKNKNGSKLWVYLEAVLSDDIDGKINFSATLSDITKLKESEDQIRLLLNSTAEAIYGLDLNGDCTFVNDSCIRILEYELPEDLIGKNMHKLIHNKYANGTHFPLEECKMHISLKEGNGTHVDDEVLWKADGTSFPAEYWAFPQERDGEVIGAVVTFLDITQRKKIEEALKRRESELLLAQQIAKMGNWEFDVVNNKTTWSENLFIIYGLIPYSIEPSYEYFRSNIHPDDLILIDVGMEKLLENKEPIEIDMRLILPNGKTKWLQNKIVPFFEDNKLVSLKGVNVNITDYKLAEEQLTKVKNEAEEANKAKSVFLANMSHEIRTPMNAILGFSEILSRMIKDNIQKDYVTSILSSGRTLLGLINDILDKSKIDAGKLKLKPGPLDIRLFVNEVTKVFGEKVKDKGLSLVTEIAENIPNALLLDELRLNQIFINLINNAIKFTDTGFVKISIRAEKIKKGKLDLIFSIEDSGKGINMKHQQKIFDAFIQEENQDSRKYGGTGLGLAITKQLVELMGGSISLESNLNKGSKFIINLNGIKILKESVKTSQLAEEVYESIIFEKTRILNVDDVEENIRVIEGLLYPFDFEFTRAANGIEALEILKTDKPDIIFSDLVMPEMSGYELIKKIRQHPDLMHIPVFAVTASTLETEEKYVLSLGFNGFISKPVNTNILIKYLKKNVPYSIQAKQQHEKEEVTETKYEKLSKQAIEEINRDITPLLLKLQKVRRRKKVEELAEILVKIGKKHNISTFLTMANEFKLAAEAFNVEKEKNLINQLPDLIDALKIVK